MWNKRTHCKRFFCVFSSNSVDFIIKNRNIFSSSRNVLTITGLHRFTKLRFFDSSSFLNFWNTQKRRRHFSLDRNESFELKIIFVRSPILVRSCLGLVDDAHARVGPPDGEQRRRHAPGVRLRVVDLHGVQMAARTESWYLCGTTKPFAMFTFFAKNTSHS